MLLTFLQYTNINTMWSYQIDRDENLVSVKRYNTVYASATFQAKQESQRYKHMVSWMSELTKEIMNDFPEEAESFVEYITIPYLSEIVSK